MNKKSKSGKMKRYSVSIPYFASVIVQVNAKNKKDAIQQAYEDAYADLCHSCADTVEMGEADDSLEPTVEVMQ